MNANISNWEGSVELIEVHCQGEIGKVVVSGFPDIPGNTMLEKMNHINQVDDRFRRFLTFEPRAAVQMSINLLLKPSRPEADAGFIVLQSDKAHAMSGSNCICVVTALIECGLLNKPVEAQTTVVLDTPAGLVTAHAQCENGRCVSVSLVNVPCFALELDREVETARYGRLPVDIAFGGVFYAIVDAARVGLEIKPENARSLMEAGMVIKSAVNQQVSLAHPLYPALNSVSYVMFRHQLDTHHYQTCTTLEPGRVDRSPCGTGSSALLATRFARGEASPGDVQTTQSIIGGQFSTVLQQVVEQGGVQCIIPRISGRGWVYGVEKLRIDGFDPFPTGFALSDTWGPLVQQIL